MVHWYSTAGPLAEKLHFFFTCQPPPFLYYSQYRFVRHSYLPNRRQKDSYTSAMPNSVGTLSPSKASSDIATSLIAAEFCFVTKLTYLGP